MPQLFDLLLYDLRSSNKNVNRLLSAGILFVLIFHFYAVEPYFEYKEQGRKLAMALSEKDAEVLQLSNQFKHITDINQNAKRTLSDIKDEIRNFPDHLREKLPKIQQALSSEPSFQAFQQSAPPQVSGLSLPSEITTFDAGVNWYVETWFRNLLVRLQDGIITPISQLENKRVETGESNLDDKANQAIQKISNYMKGIPTDFWRSYSGPGGKVAVAHNLQKEVEKSFDELVKTKITKMLEITEKSVKEQDNQLKKIKSDLEESENHMKELDSRINSLESPLGRIPADLPDLIKLFPILIVILIVMVASSIYKSNKLYISFLKEFRTNNKESDNNVFQQYAACWFLPPYPSIIQPLLLGACAVISTAIFVHACLLVSTEPELFISLTGEVESFRESSISLQTLIGIMPGRQYLPHHPLT